MPLNSGRSQKPSVSRAGFAARGGVRAAGAASGGGATGGLLLATGGGDVPHAPNPTATASNIRVCLTIRRMVASYSPARYWTSSVLLAQAVHMGTGKPRRPPPPAVEAAASEAVVLTTRVAAAYRRSHDAPVPPLGATQVFAMEGWTVRAPSAWGTPVAAGPMWQWMFDDVAVRFQIADIELPADPSAEDWLAWRRDQLDWDPGWTIAGHRERRPGIELETLEVNPLLARRPVNLRCSHVAGAEELSVELMMQHSFDPNHAATARAVFATLTPPA